VVLVCDPSQRDLAALRFHPPLTAGNRGGDPGAATPTPAAVSGIGSYRRDCREMPGGATRIVAVAVAALVAAMALSGSLAAGDGTKPGDGTKLRAKLLANEETVPKGCCGSIGSLALTRPAYKRLWTRFRLETDRPAVRFKRHAVLFAGTWWPNGCAVGYRSLHLDRKPATLRIAIEELPPDVACTAVMTPRTMAISLRRADVPKGKLHARFGDREPFSVFRVGRTGIRN
jgi:hypothetical protein